MRWFVLLLVALGACKSDPTEKEIVAAKADQTTRQLIAGLNAKNRPVLGALIVLTNAEGGPPRPLTEAEREQLVFPHPPYEFLGAGEPGTMILRDGRGQKRAVRMIVVGDDLRVLATKESFAAYTARESGGAAPAIGAGAKVVSFLLPAS